MQYYHNELTIRRSTVLSNPGQPAVLFCVMCDSQLELQQWRRCGVLRMGHDADGRNFRQMDQRHVDCLQVMNYRTPMTLETACGQRSHYTPCRSTAAVPPS